MSQNLVREWPLPIKRRCFELFLQRYTTAEIERRTGVPRTTQFRWSGEEKWGEYRANIRLDLDAVAKELLHDTLKTLNTAVRTASKLLSRIEAQLDETTPPRPLETNPSGSELCDVAKQQSNLSPSDLATLASSLKDTSDVLLRVFDK